MAMVVSAAERFTPPAIPWRQPVQLQATPDLGSGLDPRSCGEALARLCAEPAVRARDDSDLDLAVIVRQAQLMPTGKMG